MGKPHPIELRARVVAFVEEGNSHREAARHFRVSPRFVNNMVILKRASGERAPARQGHLGGGKLTGHEDRAWRIGCPLDGQPISASAWAEP